MKYRQFTLFPSLSITTRFEKHGACSRILNQEPGIFTTWSGDLPWKCAFENHEIRHRFSKIHTFWHARRPRWSGQSRGPPAGRRPAVGPSWRPPCSASSRPPPGTAPATGTSAAAPANTANSVNVHVETVLLLSETSWKYVWTTEEVSIPLNKTSSLLKRTFSGIYPLGQEVSVNYRFFMYFLQHCFICRPSDSTVCRRMLWSNPGLLRLRHWQCQTL